MKKIKFLEANSELGAGTRGASLGIDAIKVASLNKKNNLFRRYPREIIETHNEVYAHARAYIHNNMNGLSDSLAPQSNLQCMGSCSFVFGCGIGAPGAKTVSWAPS